MLTPLCYVLAATAAATAVVQPNELCTVDKFGKTVGFPVQFPVVLRPVKLSPPHVTWDLTFPHWCAGYRGVAVRVCDANSAPVVRAVSLVSARVVRTGALHDHATVYVTQYCDPWGKHVEPTPSKVQVKAVALL